MRQKERIDLIGASALIMFTALMGLNQVMIKIVNHGIQPIFQAGLRSIFAFIIVFGYAVLWKKKLSLSDGSLIPGIVCGLLFGFEFILLFVALDYTSIARASIMFYLMPVWVAIGAHYLIPNERITLLRAFGLVLAFLGVVLALGIRTQGSGHLLGDLMALTGSILWAIINLTARLSNLRKSSPEMQLIYQLAISPLVLIPAALLAGPLIRELEYIHLLLFTFQVIGVVSVGFLVWFWVLSIYPASDMASFGFLAPVFGVILGWLILGEEVGVVIIMALLLVSCGIILINWKPKKL